MKRPFSFTLSRSAFYSAATILLVGMLCFAADQKQPKKFKSGMNFFSKAQDIQLGQESAAQVQKQMKVIKDPVLDKYVNDIGKRLAGAQEASESGFPFTFQVVQDPSINAFALPGGPMFINTGLLQAVDNEGQLAGVMGHEMSHVILRHGTNQASKSQLIQLPAMLAGAASRNSMLGSLTQMGIGLGANSVLMKFSRSAETQADLLGSHLIADSGWNPIEMARFFEKLSAGGGQRAPTFMSSHPNPENREREIEGEIQSLPQQNYNYQTGQFAQMKQIAAKFPTAQQQPRQQPR